MNFQRIPIWLHPYTQNNLSAEKQKLGIDHKKCIWHFHNRDIIKELTKEKIVEEEPIATPKAIWRISDVQNWLTAVAIVHL